MCRRGQLGNLRRSKCIWINHIQYTPIESYVPMNISNTYNMYIYIYTYIYMHICMCVFIHIYLLIRLFTRCILEKQPMQDDSPNQQLGAQRA